MALFLHAAIFLITAIIIVRCFKVDGRWAWENGIVVFKYFTVLSNVLCALAALLMCFFPEPNWAWLLKYVGTAAVTVTMLTVLLFLGPSLGYRDLLKGPDFCLHLLNPLLALVSFCGFERRGLSFGAAMLGLIPVVLYGLVYLNKVVLVPEDKRWEDFYGFNKDGNWPIAFSAMVVAAFLICLGLMALQNL